MREEKLLTFSSDDDSESTHEEKENHDKFEDRDKTAKLDNQFTAQDIQHR